MDITVNLDSFRGPLDLLLFLVKRHEVDIFDIPIGKITDQFVEYLNTLRQVDVELAGDFLVMAATLMEIKSKMLLPAGTEAGAEEDPGEDPRLELVKQLIEYRKFKDAAALLESRAEEQGSRLPRNVPEQPMGTGGPPPLRPVELWDLVSAFGRLMREAEALQPTPIIVDDTPQHIYAAEVTMQLRREGRCSFHELFQPPFSRSRLIGLFLALLEMVRRSEIEVDQGERYGEFWVRLRDDSAPQGAVEEPAP